MKQSEDKDKLEMTIEEENIKTASISGERSERQSKKNSKSGPIFNMMADVFKST